MPCWNCRVNRLNLGLAEGKKVMFPKNPPSDRNQTWKKIIPLNSWMYTIYLPIAFHLRFKIYSPVSFKFNFNVWNSLGEKYIYIFRPSYACFPKISVVWHFKKNAFLANLENWVFFPDKHSVFSATAVSQHSARHWSNDAAKITGAYMVPNITS